MSVGGKCTLENVNDIGEVADMEDADLEQSGIVRKAVQGEIDGVSYFEEYSGCISCNAKVESEDGVVAECSKCNNYGNEMVYMYMYM